MVLHMNNVFLRREEETILKNISWDVEKGQHWALYGLNGAGKTALLNMLIAAHFPSEGVLEVCGRTFGKDILADQLRRKVAIVSSGIEQMLDPTDNSFEIVLSGAFASIGLYDKVTDEQRDKAKGIMAKIGNLDYANRPYEVLSQGQKQRALLGRALMMEPELLILDEPAASLDFVAREQLLEIINDIAKQENAPTIIYVTHHIEEILSIFEHTLLLKDGEVFSQGKTEEQLSAVSLSTFFDMPVAVQKANGRMTISKENNIFSDNPLTI